MLKPANFVTWRNFTIPQLHAAANRTYFAAPFPHPGGGGVAGNGTIALHALAAVPVGERQPLLELVRPGGGQGVHGHAAAAKLPQKKRYGAVAQSAGAIPAAIPFLCVLFLGFPDDPGRGERYTKGDEHLFVTNLV